MCYLKERKVFDFRACIVVSYSLLLGPDYRLVLLCSNQDEEKSHFIAKLHLLRRVYPPQAAAACKSYLASKFCVNRGTCSQASTLDHEKYVYMFEIMHNPIII